MHKIVRTVKRFAKHKKPEICGIATVAFGIAAIVTACRQTYTGLDKVVEDHVTRLEKVKAMADDDPKKKSATAMAYLQTAAAGARLYCGPFALFAASVTSGFAMYHDLKVRNKGLAVMAAGARKMLKDYRKTVAGEIGEEAEERLYSGTKTKEIEETVIDENGEEKVVKKVYDDVIDDPEESEYVKYFAKGNPNWDNNLIMDEYFLNKIQNWANEKLRADKELTLNTVYEWLGFNKSDAGMVCGWLFDKEHPFGDNKVIFDIKRVHIPNQDGKGYTLGFRIDFNVDGNIYEEKIRRKGLGTFRKR